MIGGGAPRISRPWLVVGVLGALAFLVAIAGGLAYWRFGGDSGPLRGNAQNPAPPLRAPAGPGYGSIDIVDESGRVAGLEIEVVIEAPTGAVEMQIGFDPTFSSTPWLPVASTLAISAEHTGHQMLFGRFRTGAGAEPSGISVDAVDVDPTYGPATSSVSGGHEASWVRPLAGDTIVVRIEAGRLALGAQEVYDFDNPPEGDDVSGLFGPPKVERNGEPYGSRVDGSDSLLRPYDRLIGRPIDTDRLDESGWTLTPSSGGAAIGPLVPLRMSRPAGAGFGSKGERVVPLVHDLVLRLPAALEVGASYVLDSPEAVVEPISFTFDPSTMISPAVHVNQNGYGTSDQTKVGYLSDVVPGGGGVSYGPGIRFSVIDVESGAVVVDGPTTMRPRGSEYDAGDLTGVDVFEADFSTLTDPGRYRLCFDGVGCSPVFAVDDDPWFDLTVSIARAMYHQRSGVALGPPFTSVARPRPYHPDDGMVVKHSDYRLLDSLTAPLDQIFVDLVDQGTEAVVPEAWGGHFDAGDWDRRIQHLYYVRSVIELVEVAPERFAPLDLAIPESGDAIPDLLDEGLWTLDLYLRMQGADGSIRGGIEASEHPQTSATSWSDDLAVFAYAPDPWSSLIYAGVAAQAAHVLRDYDAARSDRYRVSALAAAEWALSQPPEPGSEANVQGQEAVAAAALYKLTGDPQWHDRFLAASSLDTEIDAFLTCNGHTTCDAAWIYLTTPEEMTDPAVRDLLRQSFVATAEEIVAAAAQSSFGWTTENRFAPLVWGLGPGGSPSAIGLVRAYQLTGDERYRSAALRSAGASLGANPSNTVYVTGIGQEPVRYPVIVDVQHGGLPVWAGTPIYGPHRMNLLADDTWIDRYLLEPGGVQPLADDVPYLWQWYDVPHVAVFNEYTVFQSHAEAIYAYGFLAATS